MERADFYESFAGYLQGKNLLPADGLAPAANLFELGIVDSLEMVHVVAFLEQLLGAEIALEQHGISDFYSMAAIFDNVVARAGK